MFRHDDAESAAVPGKHSMKELADIFLYCFTMELNRVTQEGKNANVLANVIGRFDVLAGKRKLYFMFSPPQIIEMTNQLFGDLSDELFTDFVMTLTVSLQSHLIREGQDIVDLCRDLADSLILVEEGTPDSENATARDFSDRLVSKPKVMKLLKANRWLITVLLGSLFVPQILQVFDTAQKPSAK
jgi:hypothetical protein